MLLPCSSPCSSIANSVTTFQPAGVARPLSEFRTSFFSLRFYSHRNRLATVKPALAARRGLQTPRAAIIADHGAPSVFFTGLFPAQDQLPRREREESLQFRAPDVTLSGQQRSQGAGRQEPRHGQLSGEGQSCRAGTRGAAE